MPVRNGQRWLSKAIDSVLTQTFADFELLIIDDGSIDATRKFSPIIVRAIHAWSSLVKNKKGWYPP